MAVPLVYRTWYGTYYCHFRRVPCRHFPIESCQGTEEGRTGRLWQARDAMIGPKRGCFLSSLFFWGGVQVFSPPLSPSLVLALLSEGSHASRFWSRACRISPSTGKRCPNKTFPSARNAPPYSPCPPVRCSSNMSGLRSLSFGGSFLGLPPALCLFYAVSCDG